MNVIGRHASSLTAVLSNETAQSHLVLCSGGVSQSHQTSRVAQHEIIDLLDRAGAQPRGRRRDCPECGGRRTVAVDETKGVFHCHHAGCAFHGGIGRLRKRLGISREWLPDDEYRQVRQEQRRAREAAERLYLAAKVRRFQLYDELRSLATIEAKAHKAGLNDPDALNALALAYEQRPLIIAELVFLEHGHARQVSGYLAATPEQKRAVIDLVIGRGGILDPDGRFIEVGP